MVNIQIYTIPIKIVIVSGGWFVYGIVKNHMIWIRNVRLSYQSYDPDDHGFIAGAKLPQAPSCS